MDTLSSTVSPRRLSVFLCHASDNKPIVRDLYLRLKDYNVEPWLDEEELIGGQDWDLEIQKAVRKCDVVLVCLSPEFLVKEGYGQKEIKLALDTALEKPEGANYLIPLKLENCQLPERLRRFHAINYFEENGFDRLLNALRKRIQDKKDLLHIELAPINYKASRILTPTRSYTQIASPNTSTPINSVPPSRRARVMKLVTIAIILVLIGGGIALVWSQVFKLPFGARSPKVTSTATTPPLSTKTPSQILYQADFSQGSQEWLNGNHSQQWTYNDRDKLLESDGSMQCCTPATQLEKIVLNAPTTFPTTDYTIAARIKALGNNPFDTSQPPFFGIFFRGYALNGNGYMAGIIESKPGNPNTSPFSFLLVQEPNKLVNRYDETPDNLDTKWHTYWVIVRGNTYTFFRDQNQLYTKSLPQYFKPGPEIGIENYGYSLQIQSLTVYHVCIPYNTCPGALVSKPHNL